MRRPGWALIFVLLAVSSALAAEPLPPLRWLPGDPSAVLWPEGEFTAAERLQQAAPAGLSWIALSTVIRNGTEADPGVPRAIRSLTPDKVTPIAAVRWAAPAPIDRDIICLGIEPDLPLPRAQAQDVVDWTNALGGVAILAQPDGKLEHCAQELTGLAAFEALSNGKWAPDCAEGGAWDRLLTQRRRISIVGSPSDKAKPPARGGTLVLARAASESDIIAAIRRGHVVVTDRDEFRLHFTVDGAHPGSAINPAANTVEIAIDLAAPEPVDEVRLIGNVTRHTGEAPEDRSIVLRSVRVDARRLSRTLSLELDRSTRYIRAAVVAHGATRALTNPVFIGPDAPEPMPTDVREKHFARARTALESIDWADKPRAQTTLERLLDNRDVGPCTALFIAQHFNRTQLDRIRPLLTSGQPMIRALTAYMLLQVDGDAALPTVLGLFDDRDGEPRIYAARALAQFARPDLLPTALKVSRDSWPEAREYAFAALARIPRRESLIRLRQALLEPAAPTGRAAATQLTHLLALKKDRRTEFLEAFKTGNLDPKLTEAVVARTEFRPLVEKVAAEKIDDVTLLEPPDTRHVEPAGSGTLRALPVARAAAAPRIDGTGDEKLWESAPAATDFARSDGQPAAHQTIVRAAYTDDALFFLIDCAEPTPDRLVALEKEFDAHVWLDDSVDVYLSPVTLRQLEDPGYFHFCVNSKGVRFDEERRRRHWNGDWQAATAVGRTAWTVELAIPFRTLGVKPPVRGRTTWLVNVVRRRQIAPIEESFLSPCANPRLPSKYAGLRFE